MNADVATETARTSGRMEMLTPGSTIGILGGGQLGRMTALAAARLGMKVHIFCPESDGPASQVSTRTTVSGYGDLVALDRFAEAVDVVTLEFENVPVAAVERISTRVPVRPGGSVLAVCQDRVAEKELATSLNIATAAFRPIDTPTELAAALAEIGCPAVLKTRREGYDGKGQVKIVSPQEAEAAFAKIGNRPAVLEGYVDFSRELSVIVARGADGATATYPTVENRHRDHILFETIAPAPRLSPSMAHEAERIAVTLATKLGLVGLLAVELFETRDGRLLVNELAPRPHNSGHWTMDACVCDQFEQLVRAVAGLPLGPVQRHSDATMTNLIGDEVKRWPELLGEPGVHLHLYGKAEVRPGRKMGHVNRLRPRADSPTPIRRG